MAREQFALAEELLVQADQRLARHGHPPAHLARLEVAETRLAALWARGELGQAWHQLLRFDDLMVREVDAQLTGLGITRLALMRGLLLLGRQQAAQAAAMFALRAEQMATSAGVRSNQYLEAVGLHGAALAQRAEAAGRREGAALLVESVRGLAALQGIERADNTGLRQLIRAIILNAYLDTLGEEGADAPAQGFDIADWADNGPVRRALNDAAVRIASDDALMQVLIRREQDARREVEALRRSATGEAEIGPKIAGAPALRLAQRMLELESELGRLREQIVLAFPDYAHLTGARRVTAQEVANRLRPGEALVYVHTRDLDTLLWLVKWNGPVVSVRTPLTKRDMEALAQRIRTSVTFPGGRGPLRFDFEAARTLHARLIEPLAAALKGVDELIVSARGPLASCTGHSHTRSETRCHRTLADRRPFHDKRPVCADAQRANVAGIFQWRRPVTRLG